MAPRTALRTVVLALVPAALLAGCTSDRVTAPDGPAYAASKPPTLPISLSNLVVDPTTMQIGPNAANYTVTITNTKGKQILVGLQGYIHQTRSSDGAYVSPPAGGTSVLCGGKVGDLPHGSCTTGFSINTAIGNQTEPGAAVFHLELIDKDGLVLDSKDANITLQ